MRTCSMLSKSHFSRTQRPCGISPPGNQQCPGRVPEKRINGNVKPSSIGRCWEGESQFSGRRSHRPAIHRNQQTTTDNSGTHIMADQGTNMIELEHCTDMDVICGRSGPAQKHAGNKMYRTLVSWNKPLYVACPTADKIKISRSIVDAIQEQGGRFLELNRQWGAYEEMATKKAIEKTSQVRWIIFVLPSRRERPKIDSEPLLNFPMSTL